jgi:protein-S-isoprenylcysteine O-methyltransferase Ste14
MNCNDTRNPSKKIILLLVMTLGIGAVAYFIFITPSNPTMGSSLPLILSFAACPIMCAVMGGLMVIMNRIKKKNEVAKVKVNPRQQIVDQQFVETKHSLSEHSQNVHEKT